jgi:hypothetical protein
MIFGMGSDPREGLIYLDVKHLNSIFFSAVNSEEVTL